MAGLAAGAVCLGGGSGVAFAAWPAQFVDCNPQQVDAPECPGWPKWGMAPVAALAGASYLEAVVRWELFLGEPAAPPQPPLADGYASSPGAHGFAGWKALYPERPISRAEFATILARALGLDVAAPGPGVPWYRPFVDALVVAAVLARGTSTAEAHASGGAPAGSASGGWDAAIQRAEMAAWIGRALALFAPAQDGRAVAFPDLDPSTAGYADIERATRAGLVVGYPDGTFRPSGTATRAEAAKLIVLLAVRLKQHPPEVETLERVVEGLANALTSAAKSWNASVPVSVGDAVKFASPMLLFGPWGDEPSSEGVQTIRANWGQYPVWSNFSWKPIVLANFVAQIQGSVTETVFAPHGRDVVSSRRFVNNYYLIRVMGQWKVSDVEPS